jgi:fibro-slime domain-containing protein
MERLWQIPVRLGTLTGLVLALSMCSAPPLNTGPDGGSTGAAPSVDPNGVGGFGTSTGGSGPDDINTNDPNKNPCEQPDAPPNCVVVSPPACGDGEINLTPPEACDDGNSIPGDGCSGACVVEPFFVCPTAGQPCVTTIVCGDGAIGPGEACDDRNVVGGDGCSANCKQVETGFSCRTEGAPCIRVYICGDGVPDPNEGCDDGNGMDRDGCSVRCRIEQGYKCSGTPSVCSLTTCGDKKQEGAESCDDGNKVPFDGCSSTCQAEPVCETGKPCVSSCGDGILLNGEKCDDGNLRDGDGCSSQCQVEEGFNCEQPVGCEGDDCVLALPIVYRDFNENHTDFGVSCGTIERGIPKDLLSAAGKPELAAASNAAACINATGSYAEWYTTTTSNREFVDTINLYPNGDGGYVNRYGENGEKWVTTMNTGDEQGGYGTDAESCAAVCTQRANERLQCQNTCRPAHDEVDATERTLTQTEQQLAQAEAQMTPDPDVIAELEAEILLLEEEIIALEEAATACDEDCADQILTQAANCAAQCTPCSFSNDGSQWCIGGEIVELDGNPLFFPVPESFNSAADLAVASIPEEVYGGGWSADPSEIERNFYFTSEIAYWFEYKEGMTAELSFVGDDDMWVFVNGHLAVDLGGLHVPVEGRFTLNADGSIDQLHGQDGTANRNIAGTSTATAFGLVPGNVYEVKVFQAERKKVGSSYKLTLSGFNAGASDCSTNCGDAEVGPGEECDDGVGKNLGGYNQCNADCSLGPHCGDAVKQEEEVCDAGTAKNLGEYGGCAANCQLGPHCGDSIATDGEACDDGVNDGGYGECAKGCVLGPLCGDGGLQPDFEECDDGNNDDGDGCSAGCKIELILVE